LTKWRIDQSSGLCISIGDSIILTDPTVNKTTTTITVLRVHEWQRHWIILDLSFPPGSTLSVPRDRVRLGFLRALKHFILCPWLLDDIPPPFSAPLPGLPNFMATRRCSPSNSRAGGVEVGVVEEFGVVEV
jgi:hypothetical protein